jgi:hypothetical protein
MSHSINPHGSFTLPPFYQPITAQALYSFTSATFSNVGTRGYAAPSLATLLADVSYSQYSWTSNTEYLRYLTNSTYNGYQLWTVPVTGTYLIQVAGSAAWAGTDNQIGQTATVRGGQGFVQSARFSLTAGSQLLICCGQPGSGSRSSGVSTPGAGGSFVVAYTGGASGTPSAGNCTPLIISGGGGGSAQGITGLLAAGNGLQGTSGGASTTGQPGGVGGLGSGNSVGSLSCAGQGAGYTTDGGSTSCGSMPFGGQAFLNGLLGGPACTAGSNRTASGQGGWGGGGGCGDGGGGGGGGYSGGGGSFASATGNGGGGGGSFIDASGSNITYTGATNSSYGYATITLL